MREKNNHNRNDIANILNKCGFSEEMIEHLVRGDHISRYDLIDIVCQAPISLDEKLELLFDLGSKTDHTDERLVVEITNAIVELQEAKAAIEACKFKESHQRLYLFSEWYDTDSFVEKSYGVGLFRTEEEVKNNINCEYYSEDETDEEMEELLGIEDDTEAENDGEFWSRVELWNLKDSKWEHPRFDYYFMGDKICWFEKLYPKIQENGNIYYASWGGRDSLRRNRCSRRRFMSGGVDLNLSTPYKPGDIVNIDCRPFGPPFHAMILEGRDQWDCCFPTIVFKVPYTNKWRLTSLKHKRFYYDAEINAYEPMLSPLFRICKVKEAELTDDDMELKQLSELLEGSEEKASAIWETWTGLDLEDIEFRKVQEILVEESKRMRVEWL